MRHHSPDRRFVDTPATLALILMFSAGLFVHPANLVAQTAAASGQSSMITKDVLKSPCERGYNYEIQSAPKDSKEPFLIKRSPNPADPEKRRSGVVKFRKPASAPSGKATIVSIICIDHVADMISIEKRFSDLGSGPKVPYSAFAVDLPLDARTTDQLNSAFAPPAKGTGTASAVSDAAVTPGPGETAPAGGVAPTVNSDLYNKNNQAGIAPTNSNTVNTAVPCPTCGTTLTSQQSAPAAPPAAAPAPEYINDLNGRISGVANATLTQNSEVAALGGVDVVKACVAAQNCDELTPKTRPIESLFRTESDANERYTKIVTDATYAAVKAQTGLGYIDRPNDEIAQALQRVKTDSSSWNNGTGDIWTRTTFNLTDPDHAAFMWTDKMQPTNKTASDIVVYKTDGSSVPVRVNGDIVSPGGFVSQIDDRITTPKTYDTFFSAMVGTNKFPDDRANFTLSDPASPVGERTIKVMNDQRVQLATLPEQAYGALQNWGDKVYENNLQDEIKQATGGKLSFIPSDAFPKDVEGFRVFRLAPADALTPLTPAERYEKQDALLSAIQRYTPEFWASVPGTAVVSEYGAIPYDGRLKAGAYTARGDGDQLIWVDGNSKTEWLSVYFNHEVEHLAEGIDTKNSAYPSDSVWGRELFGDQYGKVYTAQSGVAVIMSGASPCTQDERPDGFPTCYAYKGGPVEHKAEMQMLIMGNYNLAFQEAQANPIFKKGFDMILQSLYKTSNGTMTPEYLASLPPNTPFSQLEPINTSLSNRINSLLRSLGR